jgi:hypothetical protein
MITHHTQLLNALIEKHNLKSYLELGVQNPANNFDKIKCEFKVSVDPDPNAKAMFCYTSDKFFSLKETTENEIKLITTYDLVFIDGYHEAEQVKRDFENSLKCLNDNGYILIHDVLPENKEGTVVPRKTKKWWGDIYKFAMNMRNYYSDIRFVTFNIDNGCMLVWKEPGYAYTSWNEAPFTWETYLKYGKILMNVVDEVII